MESALTGRRIARDFSAVRGVAPHAAAALAFAILFWEPFATMARDWWTSPDAGHGLLLAPLAVWLAWKAGVVEEPRSRALHGGIILVGAILLRYVGGAAAELFTMRFSLWAAAVGLVIWYAGWRQLWRWWLPAALLFLSIPLPAVVLGSLAFPLQLQASKMGAALLEWRQIPVLLQGNVIRIPGHELFVTEACSGLRSLSALIALGVLMGGLWLRTVPGRLAAVAAAIPIAMVLNGIRVFLTGFLVFFVSPELGTGFMHLTEGWLIFVAAFVMLGGVTWVIAAGERQLRRPAPAGGES